MGWVIAQLCKVRLGGRLRIVHRRVARLLIVVLPRRIARLCNMQGRRRRLCPATRRSLVVIRGRVAQPPIVRLTPRGVSWLWRVQRRGLEARLCLRVRVVIARRGIPHFFARTPRIIIRGPLRALALAARNLLVRRNDARARLRALVAPPPEYRAAREGREEHERHDDAADDDGRLIVLVEALEERVRVLELEPAPDDLAPRGWVRGVVAVLLEAARADI